MGHFAARQRNQHVGEKWLGISGGKNLDCITDTVHLPDPFIGLEVERVGCRNVL